MILFIPPGHGKTPILVPGSSWNIGEFPKFALRGERKLLGSSYKRFLDRITFIFRATMTRVNLTEVGNPSFIPKKTVFSLYKHHDHPWDT